ncbi:hypothetical protein [Streptomyces sp. NPDC050264]|uniref:hypothetical protein n=1 Tax=Streptomyces sp. NPDC050264 TaxID=3155038 RepID=UPI00343BDB17
MTRMRHKTLPDQDIEVQQIQVKAYERSGWEAVHDDGTPVEEPAAAAEVVEDDAAPVEKTAAAAKGRRPKTED